MFLCDAGNLDSQYQEWLDDNYDIEIVSTALAYDKQTKLLVLVITYRK